MGLTKCLLGDKVMHPNDYLAAIEFKGRDVTLTIKAVAHEELTMAGGKKDTKPVLSFNETKKRFICNKTNASSIASMYGKQALEWIGKRVTLYPTTTAVGKKQEDCIRVRERVPDAKTKPTTDLQEPTPHQPDEPGSREVDDDAKWDLDKEV